MHKTVEERFWNYVNKRSEDECWEWTGRTDHPTSNHKNILPYGQFWVGRKIISAHRFSWMIHNGPIPDGLFVLHTCDNPKCVNPSHLYLGTAKDNAIDRRDRGRQKLPPQIGSKNGYAKLTEEDVKIIRTLRPGLTFREIGERFGVTSSTIEHVVRRRKWKHVE